MNLPNRIREVYFVLLTESFTFCNPFHFHCKLLLTSATYDKKYLILLQILAVIFVTYVPLTFTVREVQVCCKYESIWISIVKVLNESIFIAFSFLHRSDKDNRQIWSWWVIHSVKRKLYTPNFTYPTYLRVWHLLARH